MPITETIQTVGKNIRALRKSSLTPMGYRSINKFAAWTDVANGTLDRIEKGKTDPQLSHILKIARKFHAYGIRPWHLFIEKLDVANPPAYLSAKERAFLDRAGEAFAALPPADQPHRGHD